MKKCTERSFVRAFSWTFLISLSGLLLFFIVNTIDNTRKTRLENLQEQVRRAEDKLIQADSANEREIASARLQAALEAIHQSR